MNNKVIENVGSALYHSFKRGDSGWNELAEAAIKELRNADLNFESEYARKQWIKTIDKIVKE